MEVTVDEMFHIQSLAELVELVRQERRVRRKQNMDSQQEDSDTNTKTEPDEEYESQQSADMDKCRGSISIKEVKQSAMEVNDEESKCSINNTEKVNCKRSKQDSQCAEAESSCCNTNKMLTKRKKKRKARAGKACKKKRPLSHGYFTDVKENVNGDIKEDVDINIGYDLKFPSPIKGESASEASPLLNMSLPTPTGGLSYSSKCGDFEDINSESMDQDSSSRDSDDDLPEGWTPIRCDDKVFAEEDLVWAKFRVSYYVPGIVKKVYKKKHRVTVVFFSPEDKQEKPLTMAYNCVLPFLSSKKDEIMQAGERMKDPTDREDFKKRMYRLDDFLAKSANKQLRNNSVWSFFKPEELEVTQEDSDPDNVKSDVKPELEDEEEGTESERQELRSLSKQGKLRQAYMSNKSKPLTEFLVSDATKDYLKKIFLEQVPSKLHNKFKTGTVKERQRMKHRGFGPIDDDSQIESFLDTYVEWLQELNKSPYLHKVNYIFDVWVPEAIVYALMHMKKYSKKKAWEMFDKGVRRTKEELQLLHEELLRKTEDADTRDQSASTFKPKKLILK